MLYYIFVARTASEDVASGSSDLKKSEVDEYPSPKDKDKDEGKIIN